MFWRKNTSLVSGFSCPPSLHYIASELASYIFKYVLRGIDFSLSLFLEGQTNVEQIVCSIAAATLDDVGGRRVVVVVAGQKKEKMVVLGQFRLVDQLVQLAAASFFSWLACQAVPLLTQQAKTFYFVYGGGSGMFRFCSEARSFFFFLSLFFVVSQWWFQKLPGCFVMTEEEEEQQHRNNNGRSCRSDCSTTQCAWYVHVRSIMQIQICIPLFKVSSYQRGLLLLLLLLLLVFAYS